MMPFLNKITSAAVLVKAHSGFNLVRHKREWIIPPKTLKENVDYSHLEYIAKIRSDYSAAEGVTYSLEGVGANKFPFHVFVVDPNNGNVRLTKKLDRENNNTIVYFQLQGIATFKNGSEAEKRIDLKLKVQDENDNAPKFDFSVVRAWVDEHMRMFNLLRTSVTTIFATDADEPETLNSKIAYSIINQIPHNYFSITKEGTIIVNNSALDREEEDTYILTVTAADLDGAEGGHTATGTVTIYLDDVNDHPPTLEKTEVGENIFGVEVMRFKTQDMDLKGTENWEAVFEIVKGDEGGYFSFKTDPETNEGILWLEKVMFRSSGTTFKGYSIKINVMDEPEGPHFDSAAKAIPLTRAHYLDGSNIIGHYPAIDEVTGEPVKNVTYLKGSDPRGWFSIDPKTAEIKLIKNPYREYSSLVNGTYFAEILSITEDMPAKTSTGTIAIQVDSGDCPTLPRKSLSMCTSKNFVIVNADVENALYSSPPFDFTIDPSETKGSWQVEWYNDTAAIVKPKQNLPPGVYEVTLMVKDQHGQTCLDPQKIYIIICQTRKVDANPVSKLGNAGLGVLLLGLMLLICEYDWVLIFLQDNVNTQLKAPIFLLSSLEEDGPHAYGYEGEGSVAGSVGCCSSLALDNDMQFLDDLGIKFKTLAEICGAKKTQTEITRLDTPLSDYSSGRIQMSEGDLLTSQAMSSSSKVQQTVASEITEHSEIRESKATNRMLVLKQQQPVYSTAIPVIQPVHYVVQQPPQNVMFMVTGTNIGSSQVATVQGQTVMHRAQTQSPEMVLMDSMGTNENLVFTSQNMFIKGMLPAGAVNGNQVSLAQGDTGLNQLSGSQAILKVEASKCKKDGRGVFQRSEVFGVQKVISDGASSGSECSTSSCRLTKQIQFN
uniref:Desmoglein-2-like n=1 Tax=Cyprinodon variegatus TaxID=28743 RepID=A0A3Q2E734_CYPVA